MTKKRKLNSNNPKYQLKDKNEKEILKKIHMSDATIRDSQGRDTGKKAAVHGIWYK